MLLNQRIAFYLEDIETIPDRAINLIIVGLVLLSLAIFVTGTYTIPASLFLGLVDIAFIPIFRWSIILRLIRYIESINVFGRISTEDTVVFTDKLFTLFTILLIYSVLIYEIEHSVNSEKFKTPFDAVYFSVVTITTLGFGDIAPKSELGKLVTVLMSLTGIALIAFIPWKIGSLIKQFVKTNAHVEMLYLRCSLSLDDAEAQFCKRCGTKLEKV